MRFSPRGDRRDEIRILRPQGKWDWHNLSIRRSARCRRVRSTWHKDITHSFPTPYLGDCIFYLIWEELKLRRAAVFLHGAQIRPKRPDSHDFLGVPIKPPYPSCSQVKSENTQTSISSLRILDGARRSLPRELY